MLSDRENLNAFDIKELMKRQTWNGAMICFYFEEMRQQFLVAADYLGINSRV